MIYPIIHGLATYLEQNITQNETPQRQVSQGRGAKRRMSQAARQQKRQQ